MKKIRGECWPWWGAKNAKGYGVVYVNNKQLRAHRFIYEKVIGEINPDLQLDHLCRNRGCVNPWHLEPVTCRENILRENGIASRLAKATHCVRGHEFSEENTYYRKGTNNRSCRICCRSNYSKNR